MPTVGHGQFRFPNQTFGNKQEKLDVKAEVTFDIPLMVQSHTKGQLISKCPFSVIVSTKIHTNKNWFVTSKNETKNSPIQSAT